jgi:hypothetical protein
MHTKLYERFFNSNYRFIEQGRKGRTATAVRIGITNYHVDISRSDRDLHSYW